MREQGCGKTPPGRGISEFIILRELCGSLGARWAYIYGATSAPAAAIQSLYGLSFKGSTLYRRHLNAASWIYAVFAGHAVSSWMGLPRQRQTRLAG